MNPTEYKINGLYTFAKACALIPIFVGMAALVVGLFDQERLQLGTVTTLFLGLGLLPLGLVTITGYYWKSEHPRHKIKSNTLKAVGLFFVAGAVVAGLLALAGRYTVEIQNATQHPLNNVRILGAGADVEIETIKPGQTVSQSFFIKQEGVLRIEGDNGEQNYSQEFSGYVSVLHGERYRKVRIDSTLGNHSDHRKS
jgi:hypothetical protein